MASPTERSWRISHTMLDFLALAFPFFFPLSSPAAAFLCSCPFTSVLPAP